ncbi:hypothetical protein BT63DRAFT_454968 [Microthyrium microscopicum]|uniref:Uncharacterized protein n=1 Tax=Microthyrium microscopicum TaxID=703497 RepID=A0A6A6U9X5_9PEZI|nr:hypothetical protein BT63DRAFT_454968 [Microthyrium microscopicum]
MPSPSSASLKPTTNSIQGSLYTPQPTNQHQDLILHFTPPLPPLSSTTTTPSTTSALHTSMSTPDHDNQRTPRRVRGQRGGSKATRNGQEPTQAPNYNNNNVTQPLPFPTLNGTPSQLYAGPTFHASPAASALPLPRFAASAPSGANNNGGLAERLEKEKEGKQNGYPETNGTPTKSPGLPLSQESPNARGAGSPFASLDILFNADRAEKAKGQTPYARRQHQPEPNAAIPPQAQQPQYAPSAHNLVAQSRPAFPTNAHGEKAKSHTSHFSQQMPAAQSQPKAPFAFVHQGLPAYDPVSELETKMSKTAIQKPDNSKPAPGHWASIYGASQAPGHSRSISTGSANGMFSMEMDRKSQGQNGHASNFMSKAQIDLLSKHQSSAPRSVAELQGTQYERPSSVPGTAQPNRQHHQLMPGQQVSKMAPRSADNSPFTAASGARPPPGPANQLHYGSRNLTGMFRAVKDGSTPNGQESSHVQTAQSNNQALVEPVSASLTKQEIDKAAQLYLSGMIAQHEPKQPQQPQQSQQAPPQYAPQQYGPPQYGPPGAWSQYGPPAFAQYGPPRAGPYQGGPGM